jgi:hypothetical protein
MKSIEWSEDKCRDYVSQSLIILDKCGDANVKLAEKLKDIVERVLSSL